MTSSPPLISLRSVSRTYRTDGIAVTAVRNVSFDIAQGEIAAVMGPSGSGKSTLMNMIGLLDLPNEGAVYLEGADVAALSEDRRSSLRARSIGFVFQSYNLLARHNALENVALPLVYCGINRRERLARAEQSLQAVGMPNGPVPKAYAGTLKSKPAEGGLTTVLNFQRVGSQRYFDAAGFPGRTLGLEPDTGKQKTAGK